MEEFAKATGKLRELQLCELSILKDVKKICDKHNITYFLSSGTLLGAVRHKGFIPWDDDVDIEMPYEDYLRFLEIAPKELPKEDYSIQTSDSDADFNRMFAKVRKNNTTMMATYETKIKGHHGVWIDIFPMTYISGKLDLKLKKLAVRLSNFLLMNEQFEINKQWIKSQTNIVFFALISLIVKLPAKLRRRLHNLLTKFVFHSKKGKYISYIWTNITSVYDPDVFFGGSKQLLFEDELFGVPYDYDKYLRVTYGDYMTPPPPDKRDGGHGNLIIDLKNSWHKYV